MINLDSYNLEKIKYKDLLNIENNNICLTSFSNIISDLKKIQSKYEKEYLSLSKHYSKENSVEIKEDELFITPLISVSKRNQINISLYSGFFVSFLEIVNINKNLKLIFRDYKKEKKLEGLILKINERTELIFCWGRIIIKYNDSLKQVKINNNSILFIDLNEKKEYLYTIKYDLDSHNIYKWISNESITKLKDSVLCEVFYEEVKISQSRYYNIQNKKIITTYITPKLEDIKKNIILNNVREILCIQKNNDKVKNFFSDDFKEIGLINDNVKCLTTEQEKNILTMNLMI